MLKIIVDVVLIVFLKFLIHSLFFHKKKMTYFLKIYTHLFSALVKLNLLIILKKLLMLVKSVKFYFVE